MSEKLDNIDAEIRRAMAKAFFASAYADQWEEAEDAPSMSGVDVMNVLPDDTDPAALDAARTLEIDLLSANRQFARLAGVLDWLVTVCPKGGDRARNADMLGHYLAMQAMGHGVGLRDAFGGAARDAIKVPYVEFGGHSLERDYFPQSED